MWVPVLYFWKKSHTPWPGGTRLEGNHLLRDPLVSSIDSAINLLWLWRARSSWIIFRARVFHLLPSQGAGKIAWRCHLPPFICTRTESRDQTFIRPTGLLSLHLFLPHWNIGSPVWQSTPPAYGEESAECASAVAKPVSYLTPGSLSRDSFMADTKEESIGGQGVDISFSKKWSIEDQSPSSVYQPWEVTFFS